MNHTIEGFRSGLASGAFFGGYLVMMVILLWQSIADWQKLRRDKGEELRVNQANMKLRTRLIVEAHLAFSFVGMLFALLLMYKLTEGSKHLLTFMAAGIFVISLMRTKYFKKIVLLGATFAFLYSYRAVDPYDYQVPYESNEVKAQIAYWEDVFDANLKLTDVDVPNYDNVVIWTFSDTTPEGGVTANWQIFYGLPEGFGISCCMPDYVTENLENLQSRYLATVSGGTIDGRCAELGYREIARDADMVLYERY